MPDIKLNEYCCQGGEKQIDASKFKAGDLTLAVRGNRELRFSPLGNTPRAPRIALVGITSGRQSEVFARYLRHSSVHDAARRAAFEGAQTEIKELLSAQGFAASLSLNISGDLNDNPEIFTTSLVKCGLMVNGSYKYKAPDIATSPEATYCIVNRFLADIARFPSLDWIIVFDDSGWEAVSTIEVGGKTILETLLETGAGALNFPHFAQNFQQRAIFSLRENEEKEYFERKPKHRPYAPKARAMRTALVKAMKQYVNVT